MVVYTAARGQRFVLIDNERRRERGVIKSDARLHVSTIVSFSFPVERK